MNKGYTFIIFTLIIELYRLTPIMCRLAGWLLNPRLTINIFCYDLVPPLSLSEDDSDILSHSTLPTLAGLAAPDLTVL